MIQIILAGMNVLYVMVPVVVVVFVVAGLLRQSKSRGRDKVLRDFRAATFRTEDELSWYIAHDVMGAAGYSDCVVYKVDQADRVCRQIAAFGPKNPDKMSI